LKVIIPTIWGQARLSTRGANGRTTKWTPPPPLTGRVAYRPLAARSGNQPREPVIRSGGRADNKVRVPTATIR